MTVDETAGKGLLEATVVPEGTVYVVQMLEECEVETDGDPVVEEYWKDVAMVTLPKRAHRKGAVEQMLGRPENAKLRPTGDVRHRFRVLDADAAEEIPAGVRISEELVVG